MLTDKESHNERMQFKCTSCGWGGGIAETTYDEIHIKIKRPILKLASMTKTRSLSVSKKRTWHKPKVTAEIKCQGVSPTHVSSLK